jgi:hypothetical protein
MRVGAAREGAPPPGQDRKGSHNPPSLFELPIIPCAEKMRPAENRIFKIRRDDATDREAAPWGQHPTTVYASDIRALVTAAVDAIKMVEVLTGGVSDRAIRVGGLAEEALTLLRQLEAQKRAGAQLTAATPPGEAGESDVAR